MAITNNMHFTYPILCNFNDDYINVDFIAGTTGIMEKSKKYSKIKTFVNVSNKEINKLINEEKAKIIVKVYCNSTKYRSIFEIKLGEDELVLKNRDINNLVDISTFIVLNENITNYTNNNFNKDYKGKYFDLEKGTILAIGKQEKIFIEKDINDLTKLNSVILICKDDKPNASMNVDYSEDKIRIKLSEESYETYSNYAKYCVPIVNSMIIIPSMMYVLDELAKGDQDIEDYNTKKWYRVLSKKATDIIEKQFTIEYIKNFGALELLQKIFDDPIYSGLDMIKNKWSGEVDNNDN